MSDKPAGCARPTGAVVGENPTENNPEVQTEKEATQMVMARVGAQAPDFEAPAYHKGDFTQVKLSDYAGKWLLLCFYPGDFTFV